jgi:glycosyltransferase involved in cell wall biosynthesis
MTSFSIIVPSYNQQEYLPDALESVFEQTYPAQELIVIDDGSTDRSLEIAERYKYLHPIKVVSQRNKGLSSARNTGIMNSHQECDYILPLDADDILMPNCLEKMAEAIEKTDADIIAPSFKHFGVLNSPLILGDIPTLEDFKTANRLPYFCAIRREALLECGGYSPRMDKGFEDYHIWFDLLSRGKKIAIIREILVLYRTKENSMLIEANKHRGALMSQIAKDFPEVFQI